MKILYRGYACKNHSWAMVAQGIIRGLIKKGYEVHIFSTNGNKDCPEDLKENLIGYVNENENILNGRLPDQLYDSQISYTSMKNFPFYFANGKKNRFGIWCYEWQGINNKSVIPNGFAKQYIHVDKLFPPSNFAKQIFLDAGIPESNMQVLSHGINVNEIESATAYPIKTKKSHKIFVNLSQVHLRKNIENLLSVYGKAFNKNDDVCLVMKVQANSGKQPFEQSYQDLLKRFYDKYKNHADVEVIKEFVPNIYSLYKSCDICFSFSRCEAFGLTGLEAAATGLINIAPNYGGFTDFLNNDNAFMINGKIVRADPRSMYWNSNPHAVWFDPSIDEAVDKLKFIINNKVNLQIKAQEFSKYILENYSWQKIVEQIKFQD